MHSVQMLEMVLSAQEHHSASFALEWHVAVIIGCPKDSFHKHRKLKIRIRLNLYFFILCFIMLILLIIGLALVQSVTFQLMYQWTIWMRRYSFFFDLSFVQSHHGLFYLSNKLRDFIFILCHIEYWSLLILSDQSPLVEWSYSLMNFPYMFDKLCHSHSLVWLTGTKNSLRMIDNDYSISQIKISWYFMFHLTSKNDMGWSWIDYSIMHKDHVRVIRIGFSENLQTNFAFKR